MNDASREAERPELGHQSWCPGISLGIHWSSIPGSYHWLILIQWDWSIQVVYKFWAGGTKFWATESPGGDMERKLCGFELKLKQARYEVKSHENNWRWMMKCSLMVLQILATRPSPCTMHMEVTDHLFHVSLHLLHWTTDSGIQVAWVLSGTFSGKQEFAFTSGSLEPLENIVSLLLVLQGIILLSLPSRKK